MDITEMARRSGLPASTPRFYEEKGLIASIGRGLRRVFNPNVLERLALIAVGRAAGFCLDEIVFMFASDRRSRIGRQMLAVKAEELDGTIRKLTEMRDGLRCCLLRSEPHGMSDLPPHPKSRCIWSYWGAKERRPRFTTEPFMCHPEVIRPDVSRPYGNVAHRPVVADCTGNRGRLYGRAADPLASRSSAIACSRWQCPQP
jgi:DNA-binding transcriptional MerR regulator